MKNRRIAYGILLLFLITAEIYVNNVYSLLLLFVGVLVPLVSLILCILSKGGLSIDFSTVESIEKGQKTEIQVNISNGSMFSIASMMVVLNVYNALTGSSISQKFFTTVGAKGKQTSIVEVSKSEVGKLFVTVQEVVVFDLLKLFSYSVKVDAENTILVTPEERSVDVLLPQVEETTGESLKYSEDFAGNDPTEIFDIREYAVGDEPRRVHWKLSSKTDTLMVKEFSKPLNYSAVVLFEIIKSSSEAIETSVTQAVNISRMLLNAGIMNTIIWFDGASDELCSHNISSYTELDNAALKIISSTFYEEETKALVHYLTSDSRDLNSTVMYVSPVINEEETARLYSEQQSLVYRVVGKKVEAWRMK